MEEKEHQKKQEKQIPVDFTQFSGFIQGLPSLAERGKRKSLTGKVVGKMVATMLMVNIILFASIAYWVSYLIEDGEKKYMAEVITRVSEQVDASLNQYIDANYAVSQNAIIRDFLQNTKNVGVYSPPNNDNYNSALAELTVIANRFSDTVLNVTIGSVQSDNIIDHTGRVGGSYYQLSSTAFYSAITTGQPVVSASYPEYATGIEIITIASPVFSTTGEVLGLVGLDIDVNKISNFVTDVTFGTTGSTFIIDKNDTMLVHPNPDYVGQVMSSGIFEGGELATQLANPTGEIFQYQSDGVKRLGGISVVSSSGWKLISAIDVAEFETRSRQVAWNMTVLQIIGMVIVVVVCAVDFRKKLSPMRDIQEYMREVSHGNLHTDLDFTSDDEMGDLVLDIRHTIHVLNSYVSHLSKTLADFGRGNFLLEDDVDYVGDFKPIQESVETFVALISSSLLDLRGAAKQVGTGAEQLSGGAQNLATGASEQAASVEALNRLISSVNDEILETAIYSSRISSYAENISMDIVDNNDKMQKLAVSVVEIKDLSDEVKRIIKAIEEVAFQTNILALNAAVEAARAGTTGKGFAVVAEEVRALSLKTAEAVQDTTQIITNMATFIEASTDLADETSQGLLQIVQESKDFVANMAKISHSTADQSSTMTEIHQGIEHISNIVGQNSAVSEESAAASEELSSQSSVMIELIEQFKTPHTEAEKTKNRRPFQRNQP